MKILSAGIYDVLISEDYEKYNLKKMIFVECLLRSLKLSHMMFGGKLKQSKGLFHLNIIY